MEELRGHITAYNAVDDQITELNKQLFTLRYQRGVFKTNLIDMLSGPAYATYEKVQLTDGTVMKIKRPGTWRSAPSLSQANLNRYLDVYFANTANPNANDCFAFIKTQMSAESVQNTFDIERSSK